MTRSATLVLVVYAAALVASHAVRASRDAARPLGDGGTAVEVPAIEAGVADPGKLIRFAFRDLGANHDGSLPVLLLHGSPGDGGQLLRFASALAGSRRVIVPDLPGFGASTASIPDYSIHAHAIYLQALLDRLAIPRVHVIGFSMGGGVALTLAALDANRLASLTLLSSIGAQEYELLGSYDVNHVLHFLQLAGLWALGEGVPHFGALDGGGLDVLYARNFYDTDQRPLRGILSRLQMPVLILHGLTDPLVPIEAVYEHARLVAQSELVTFDTDHFMPFRMPEPIAGSATDFFTRVESGRAVTGDRASPERVAAAAAVVPVKLPPARGVTAAVAALLLAVATLVSEDLACLTAGMLVAQGRISFTLGVVSSGAGIVIGDVLLFLAGRSLSRSGLAAAIRRRALTPEFEARTARWLRERGGVAVFASRFLPGTRLPTYVGAGWLGMPLGTFLVYFILAAALWTPLLVGFGVVPTKWLMQTRWGSGSSTLVSVVTVVVLALAFRLLHGLITYRHARWLVSGGVAGRDGSSGRCGCFIRRCFSTSPR